MLRLKLLRKPLASGCVAEVGSTYSSCSCRWFGSVGSRATVQLFDAAWLALWGPVSIALPVGRLVMVAVLAVTPASGNVTVTSIRRSVVPDGMVLGLAA